MTTNLRKIIACIIVFLFAAVQLCSAQTDADGITVQKVSAHVYQHISWLSTHDFGKVDCNGMIVVNQNEAIVFDTPADNKSAEALIDYLHKQHCTIKAVIATHFHDDCVGGLQAFNKHHIACYATTQTIALLQNKGNADYQLLKGFDDSLVLTVGNKKVMAQYFGQGHTKDNIVGYFAEDKAVFGGCLIKAAGAGKGNLADANTAAWPATVRKVKQRYPNAAIVIPGHGKRGGVELFDYTIHLFE